MSDSIPPAPANPGGAAIALALAWLALTLTLGCLQLVFAGWVGPVEIFLLWTALAALLWRPTHRRLGWAPLHRRPGGRWVLGAWAALAVYAFLGGDHHGPLFVAAGLGIVCGVVILVVGCFLGGALARHAWRESEAAARAT